MIRPPGWDGVLFSEASDGDMRADQAARATFAATAGIGSGWAVVHQVHGSEVVRVDHPGESGDADALWTDVVALPLAVFTADCFGVVLQAISAVGVAHAGWRGARAGVVATLREAMTAAGHPPSRAGIGPGIGSCCFEVGAEVAVQFPESVAMTGWGTTSVDIPRLLRAQLSGLEVWASGSCTGHDPGWFSHRRDRTPRRMASLGWVP